MASGHRARCLRRLASAAHACGIVRNMTANLRRVIIAAEFKRAFPDQPETAEIRAIRLAWKTPKTLLPKPRKSRSWATAITILAR
jgi:hypothetical protein